MTILTPKEVSALLKDINFDSQQADSQQADSQQADSSKSNASLSDFHKARAEKKNFNVYSQTPQKAVLQKTNKAASPANPFIPPQFKPKNTPQQTKIFENLYPALEAVLAKFISFLQITTADFSQKKTTIFYKSVIRTRFKDFTLPKDAIINAYQLEPMNNFVFFSVETLFLENLFQEQINQTQISPQLESKKIKELHKTLHKSFFVKCEKNWNQAWNHLYPVQSQYTHSLLEKDFYKIVSKRVYGVHFIFEIHLNKKKYSFSVSFHDKLVSQLTRDRHSLNSLLPLKTRKKIFMQNIFQKKVRAQILLGGYKLSLQELVALEEGDTILTEYKRGEPVLFVVEDSVKFLGEFFSYQDKKAVKLVKSLEPKDE